MPYIFRTKNLTNFPYTSLESWLKTLSNEYIYAEQNPNRTRAISIQSWPLCWQKRLGDSPKFSLWRQVPENWQVTRGFLLWFFLSWSIDYRIKSEKTKSERSTFLNFNHPISHCGTVADIWKQNRGHPQMM